MTPPAPLAPAASTITQAIHEQTSLVAQGRLQVAEARQRLAEARHDLAEADRQYRHQQGYLAALHAVAAHIQDLERDRPTAPPAVPAPLPPEPDAPEPAPA